MENTNVRKPAMAGTFYPGDGVVLASEVSRLLAAAASSDTRQPKAIIAPHAGYIYSGSTAAAVYAKLNSCRAKINRVVLLGPSHRAPVRCMAASSVTAFATPLQTVPLDRKTIDLIAAMPQVEINDAAHASEHSLEVQIPFLQTMLDNFTLIPLAVGHASAEDVADVLDALWGGDETLIVVSSDLSHFLPYASAKVRDRMTCDAILDGNPHIAPEEACGAFGINGLLVAAQRHHLKPELVQLCNSGDTAGDKSSVVGYAAFAFYPGESEHA